MTIDEARVELSGDEVPVEGTLINFIFSEYLPWCRKHRSQRTTECYKDFILNFEQMSPNLTVEDLKPYHIEKWLDANA